MSFLIAQVLPQTWAAHPGLHLVKIRLGDRLGIRLTMPSRSAIPTVQAYILSGQTLSFLS